VFLKAALFVGILYISQGLAAGASGFGIGAPRLGYVWDAGAGKVVPIQGIPGASIAGPAFDPGLGNSTRVWAASRYFMAVSGGKTLVATEPDAAAREIAVPLPPDQVFFSPRETAAVLWSEEGRFAQVVAGLPGNPAAARRIVVPDWAGRADLWAISDDGEVLLAWGTDAAVPLLSIDSSGRVQTLPVAGPVTAAAFRPGSRDALAAAGPESGIYLLRNAGAGEAPQLVAVLGDVAGAPSALAFDEAGGGWVAADAEGTIVTIAMSGEISAPLVCGCTLSGLRRLNAESAFLLNRPAGGELLRILDLSRGAARLLFVPASVTDENGRGDQ